MSDAGIIGEGGEAVAIALSILDRFKVDYPDAFIAGGFLRDIDLGREPKDLDIFTTVAVGEEAMLANDDQYEGRRIVGVEKFREFKWPVDLIHCAPEHGTTPEEIVSKFALGFQQIYLGEEDHEILGAEWKFIRLPHYKLDISDKTMTIRRCVDWHEAKRIHYKVKDLKQKFPDFVVHIPAEFSEFTTTLLTGVMPDMESL